jgi:beta-galactosidase
MVWTGLDYLGESGIGRYYYEGDRPGESYAPGGQPEWHGAYCGDVDMTGWRKPISHYRDMLWNDGTPLYMAVKEPNGYHGTIKETQWSVWPTWESWNWPGWEGKPIEVEVYTKEPSVALYCNGTLVGKKDVSRDTQFKAVFTLPYEAGVVEAVTDNGRTSLTTAGEAARLRLTADRTVIAADGQDLSFITVEVVDREGRVVPEAAIPCTVKVSGQGLLMAAASADLKDFEPTTSPQVTTWKGRAIIVVRSARKAGTAKVTVASQLPQASLTLKIK